MVNYIGKFYKEKDYCIADKLFYSCHHMAITCYKNYSKLFDNRRSLMPDYYNLISAGNFDQEAILSALMNDTV